MTRQVIAANESFHFTCHQRRMMAEDLDTLERKQPAGIGRGAECRVQTIYKSQQHRKIVNFGVLMCRAYSDQTFNFTEQEPHHIKHMDCCLKQKPYCYRWIASPYRIQQFTSIHLDVC